MHERIPLAWAQLENSCCTGIKHAGKKPEPCLQRTYQTTTTYPAPVKTLHQETSLHLRFVLHFMNCRNLWKLRQCNSTCPWVFISLSLQNRILQRAVLVQLKPNALLSQYCLICFCRDCNIFQNSDFHFVFKNSFVFTCVSRERQDKPNATLIHYLLEHLVMNISKESSQRSKKLRTGTSSPANCMPLLYRNLSHPAPQRQHPSNPTHWQSPGCSWTKFL